MRKTNAFSMMAKQSGVASSNRSSSSSSSSAAAAAAAARDALFLDGTISPEVLQEWAAGHWNKLEKSKSSPRQYKPHQLYVDLYHEQISKQGTEWLLQEDLPKPTKPKQQQQQQEKQHSISSTLAKAFFGSIRFLPERLVLAPYMFYLPWRLPPTGKHFRVGSRFLLWRVAFQSSRVIILTWSFGSWLDLRGCTLVALDAPTVGAQDTAAVYHGNCLDSNAQQYWFFPAMIPLHQWYARFLLAGMRSYLERQAAAGASK